MFIVLFEISSVLIDGQTKNLYHFVFGNEADSEEKAIEVTKEYLAKNSLPTFKVVITGAYKTCSVMEAIRKCRGLDEVGIDQEQHPANESNELEYD